MNEIKLYNYFRSSTSYRVRIALELKEIPYQYIPIHLVNNGGEQNTENYRRVNPMGGVPTIEHNQNFISQSLPIIEYIDEVFPQKISLYPTDFYLKAKVKQVCEIINADSHPLQNLRVLSFLEKDFQLTESQRQKWLQHWISSGLAAFEKTISSLSGHYCIGDQLTAADLVLIPQMFSAQRFKVDTTQFPLLQKINKSCLELAAFQKAHPMRQPDTPAEMRI